MIPIPDAIEEVTADWLTAVLKSGGVIGCRFTMTGLPGASPGTGSKFEEVYGLRIGRDAVALGRRLNTALDWLRTEFAARPRTICHGDFRTDNLFFGDNGSADGVVFIDWQLCTRSLGSLDVARLLGGSEPSRERTNYHMEGFTAWHEALMIEGVRDYALEEAFEDFRLGALMNLCLPVHVFAKWGPDPGGRRGQLLDVIATGMFTFALEVDAAARLPGPSLNA